MNIRHTIFSCFYLALSLLNKEALAQRALKLSFPYAKEGMTKEEAAVHLLSRFSYGYNAADVKKTMKMGLERWFAQQLVGSESDTTLARRLDAFKDVLKSNQEIYSLYPKAFRVRRQAIEEGVWSKDSIGVAGNSALLADYMASKEYKREKELIDQFVSAKVVRAVYSPNQLSEVMTDFWFNHFNVSFSKGQCTTFIPNYEAAVIRPNVFGQFLDLLTAVAQSPAMLYYLDNATSVAATRDGKKGLNENYARELLELHTLGVDGGYTQQDVTEVARVLTGWTVKPMAEPNRKGNQKGNTSGRRENGDFLFKAATHDRGTKTVLGHHFSNQGYDEGLQLLALLSEQEATAQFISRKLAIRFVADTPSTVLVNKMAKRFLDTKGNIAEVLVTMVNAREFWDRDVQRTKIKTPFELAVSAARSLRGDINDPVKFNNWVSRMGEKKFYYIAPTGFPDYAAYWINSGSLLNRMNFGLNFANEKSTGVCIDLLAPLSFREPESMRDALKKYSNNMLPTVDTERLLERLEPLLTVDNLQARVGRQLNDAAPDGSKGQRKNKGTQEELAQVLGLIIGSPEFQRR